MAKLQEPDQHGHQNRRDLVITAPISGKSLRAYSLVAYELIQRRCA